MPFLYECICFNIYGNILLKSNIYSEIVDVKSRALKINIFEIQH